MSGSSDPMGAVRQYLDGFNNGDPDAMSGACADPMQILDGMPPHVFQGPTAARDWYAAALAEGEHLGITGYHIEVGNHAISMSRATTPISFSRARSLST